MKKRKRSIIVIVMTVAIIIIIIFAAWNYLSTDFITPRGEFSIEEISSTGAIISISNMKRESMLISRYNSYYFYLERYGIEGDVTLVINPTSQQLITSEGLKLEEIGSMEFVDNNGDKSISIGDEVRLGTEATSGHPLMTNETYRLLFDDDSDGPLWEIQFTTFA